MGTVNEQVFEQKFREIEIKRTREEAQKLIKSQPWFNDDTEEQIMEFVNSKPSLVRLSQVDPLAFAEFVIEKFGSQNQSMQRDVNKNRASGVFGAASGSSDGMEAMLKRQVDEMMKNPNNIDQKKFNELEKRLRSLSRQGA